MECAGSAGAGRDASEPTARKVKPVGAGSAGAGRDVGEPGRCGERAQFCGRWRILWKNYTRMTDLSLC